jgi:phosphomannomutase/phosphoglucomutase
MAQPSSSSSNIVRVAGLLSLALGVFGLLVGAVVMYTSFQGQLDSQQASMAAQDQARAVGDALADIQAAIDNPQVIGLARELLQNDQTDSQALEAAVQRRGVTNIIDLKVFPNEVELIELGRYPEPDFTVIEMLLQAIADGQAPIQVHYPGQAIENLALAQAVEVDAGVEGVIFLRVPVSMASSLLAVSSSLDAIAMVSGRGEQLHTLRSFGQVGGPVEVTPIPGSNLSLHWTHRTFASGFSKRSAIIILSIGVILLMVGLLVRQRFGVLETQLDRRASKQARADGAGDEAASTAAPPRRPSPANKATGSTRSSRRPDRVKAKKKKAPSPPVADDLPDWLLDSDQIDQTAAPLGGEDDLPDLPDTLSDQVDDTVAFDADDDELPESKPRASDAEASANKPAKPASDELTLEETQPGTTHEDSSAQTPSDSFGDGGADIGWDDFDSELEHEDLLSGSDEQAIDAALAELEGSGDDPPPSKPLAADAADTDGQSDQAAANTPAPAGAPVLDESLFRANSIGGIVGEHLDSRAATLIGEAIGSEAKSRGVDRIVVGRDGRLDGPVLMSGLTQGLRAAGVDVIDIGAVPIPVLSFAATELTSGCGVMVTGSHYPANHNGFRVRFQNEVLSDGAIQAIRQRIDNQDLTSGSGQLEEDALIDRYVERIGSDVQLERPLKVVVDCGNGIAGAVVPAVLSAIGADVIPLYSDVDGSFPNHLPDPSRPENLEDLKLCVRNFHADIGLAFDGDGDRLAAVAGDGRVLWTDQLLMLLAPEILERNVGARVVIDSASSLALRELIQAAGGKPLVERSAEAFVEQRMRKESALLGGLFSGHLFVAERWYPFDDAIYASARLLEALAADTRPIAEIIDQLPNSEATPEIRVELAADEAEDLITGLIADGNFGDAELSMVDGLRADYPDGWGMVRASHQGRGLVFRFEAESAKALRRIKATFGKQVKAWRSDLTLPF